MMSQYAPHHAARHLSQEELIAYVHRQLSDAERESFDQHLDACLECRRRLVEHADFQRRVSEGLTTQLAGVSPSTGWTEVAPRVTQPRQGRTFWSRRTIYSLLTAAYALVLVVGGYFLFRVIRDLVQEQEAVNLSEQRPAPTATFKPMLDGVTITAVPTAVEPTPGIPIWDGTGRVNLLLMGIDQRKGQQGYWRTDTMIIVSVDPQSGTVGMLSVPRDLWVPIPGYDVENRINTAHYYGDYYDYPGGGPALARDTVVYNLGIPIHHYARINFTAFETLIDEIGGVDVYVERTINDPAYPDEGIGYDPFYLAAGQQHLDGETALKYARTRHGGSDFDRARRQQKVLLAVRDRVVRLDLLPRLIANGPQILEALGDSIRTDLTYDQAVQLARILNEIPPESFQGAVIDQNYTQPYTTETGAQVLIPLRDKIAELHRSFFESP